MIQAAGGMQYLATLLILPRFRYLPQGALKALLLNPQRRRPFLCPASGSTRMMTGLFPRVVCCDSRLQVGGTSRGAQRREPRRGVAAVGQVRNHARAHPHTRYLAFVQVLCAAQGAFVLTNRPKKTPLFSGSCDKRGTQLLDGRKKRGGTLITSEAQNGFLACEPKPIDHDSKGFSKQNQSIMMKRRCENRKSLRSKVNPAK